MPLALASGCLCNERRARMSEFPWGQAEASKQLKERVTWPVGLLPGGLAGCSLPIDPRVTPGLGL